MDRPVLLLFNFSPERTAAVAPHAAECGYILRRVSGREQRVPLQQITGPAPADPLTRPAFGDEMMVFPAPDRDRMFRFLDLLRENGVPPVPLKAVLTPFNRLWTPEQLHGELVKEHAAVTGKAPPPAHG